MRCSWLAGSTHFAPSIFSAKSCRSACSSWQGAQGLQLVALMVVKNKKENSAHWLSELLCARPWMIAKACTIVLWLQHILSLGWFSQMQRCKAGSIKKPLPVGNMFTSAKCWLMLSPLAYPHRLSSQ